MFTSSFYRLVTIVVVLLSYQTNSSAQVLRVTPEGSVTNLEDSVVKPTPGYSVQKSSSPVERVLPISASGLVKLSGVSYNRYQVLDSQGELWIAGPGTRDQTIDLGHLPTGIYYLHLSTADGELVSKVLLGSKAVRE